MSVPIRLPDGRTLGEVLVTALYAERGWQLPNDYDARTIMFGGYEAAARAVLAADPARAQALAALEQVLPFLRSEQQWEMQYESGEEVCGYPTPVGPVLDEVQAAIAALKGGAK